MPVKVNYYVKDKEGFALEDKTYYSEEENLYLWQHIYRARKEAGVSRDNFFIINTSCSPHKKPTWINPDWPVIPFPKLKKTRLAFGRYVIEKPPKPVELDTEEPI